MSIFLSILKVLGIILGILLAVLLVLILLTLFVPICYHAKADIPEKSKVSVKARVSWFFSLIQIKLLAEGKDLHIRLSVLGWKKDLYPKPEEKIKPGRAKKEEQMPREEEEPEVSIQAAQLTMEEPEGRFREEEGKEETFRKKRPKRRAGKSLQKYLPWNMMNSWILKVKNFLFSIKEKLDNIKKEISDENNKNAVSHIWKELKRMLRHIGPRRGKADLRYSIGDPAYTGQLTGMISMMPFFYKKKVNVIPDFSSDKCYIRGSFQFHGHIQVFPMLCIAFRIYRDKNIMNLVQKFK